LLGTEVLVAGKTGTTNERRDSWFVGYTRDLVGVAWVGLDDNRPAGVTGSNAAMRIWAGLFRNLPLEPISQDLPDGAHWLWVRRDPARRSAAGCAGAEQMPFITGSEPELFDECAAGEERGSRESFWKKWFGDD
jgi:penicillin-binding protein 1B